MSGISLSCNLLGTGLSAPATVMFSSAILPAISLLYDGQALSDVQDYTAMTAAGNFTSSGGAIVSVATDPLGDATDTATPLNEGQTFGFRVSVTDSSGNTQSFTTSQDTVQYRFTFTQTTQNEGTIDINPLVGDNETLEIVIGTPPYAATYSGITVGAVRSGPYSFGGGEYGWPAADHPFRRGGRPDR